MTRLANGGGEGNAELRQPIEEFMTVDYSSSLRLTQTHLRIARPTDQLERVIDFYSQVLGFVLLGRFQDHDGFDGAMLGHADLQYHLELTASLDHPAGRAPSLEHLLVFYLPSRADWQRTIDHIESFGLAAVQSLNPYWDRQGRAYEDPDGYRVVIQNGCWPPKPSSALLDDLPTDQI
ncbi:MAG: VOC family protein [Planctomycetota bacterium]|nr:VOC family protein [Planctomycetota bacterium]